MPDVPRLRSMPAIEIHSLGVCYRRYHKKVTTLKETIVGLFQGSHYESFWALRCVDVAVGAGETLAIIGPNGSGKSTLMKAIAGVLPPAEGEVNTNGRIAPLLALGGGFNPQLTGRENIFLNGAIMGLSRRQVQERYDRIVHFAGIGDFIDAPLTTYSSGMLARLGFSVATDVDPDILLLDEVLSVGDEDFRTRALARTKDFFKSGRTVVMASHAMKQVQDLCETAIYLRRGKVVSLGPTGEVVKEYLADVRRAANKK